MTLLDKKSDLMPEYMFKDETAVYLRTTERKISMYIKYGLLRYTKFGKNYVVKKSWADEFADTWSGYDLSNESKIKFAIKSKQWKDTHSL